MDTSLFREFQLDWRLAGKAERTAKDYTKALKGLLARYPEPTLNDVKAWIASTSSVAGRRKRGQAVRAFGKWASGNEYDVFAWWKSVPLSKETMRPQETATESDYKKAVAATRSVRDRALIEVLWSCGLRRSELISLDVGDVNLPEGFLVIRTSKNGRPRVVPLSPAARHALRKHLGGRTQGSMFGMTPNAVRLLLQRLGAPSAHAWRRGWAVQALRNGVSEASVRAAAGWTGGAMVARYTRALSGELALAEFQKTWS